MRIPRVELTLDLKEVVGLPESPLSKNINLLKTSSNNPLILIHSSPNSYAYMLVGRAEVTEGEIVLGESAAKLFCNSVTHMCEDVNTKGKLVRELTVGADSRVFSLAVREGSKLLYVNTALNLRKHYRKWLFVNSFPVINFVGCNKGECDLVVTDITEGTARRYSVEAGDLLDLRCVQDFCVAYFRDKSIAFSYDLITDTLSDLSPLMKCGDNLYYVDRQGVVTKVKDGDVEPITIVSKSSKVVGCYEGDAIAIKHGSELSVVREGLFTIYSVGPSLDVKVDIHSVVIRKSENFFRLTNDFRESVGVEGLECVPLPNSRVACLSRDLTVFIADLKDVRELSIDTVRPEVSAEGYAEISIKPWTDLLKLRLDNRLRVVKSSTVGEKRLLQVRPKILGMSDYFEIRVSSPFGFTRRSLYIRSEVPELLLTEILDGSYSPDGSLIEYPDSNLKFRLRLRIRNNTPEVLEARLEGIKCEIGGDTYFQLKPGVNELDMTLIGRSRGGVAEIRVLAEDGLGRDYVVGGFTLPLLKYEVAKPSGIEEIEKLLGSKLIDLSKILALKTANRDIEIICGNGSVIRSLKDLEDSVCVEPITVKTEIKSNQFKWTHYFMSYLEPEVLVVPGNTGAIKVESSSRTKGDLLGTHLIIRVPPPNEVLEGVSWDIKNLPHSLAVEVCGELPSPVSLVVDVGGKSLILEGSKCGELTVNLPDIFRGIKLVVLPPGRPPEVRLVRASEILARLLVRATRTAYMLAVGWGRESGV